MQQSLYTLLFLLVFCLVPVFEFQHPFLTYSRPFSHFSANYDTHTVSLHTTFSPVSITFTKIYSVTLTLCLFGIL